MSTALDRAIEHGQLELPDQFSDLSRSLTVLLSDVIYARESDVAAGNIGSALVQIAALVRTLADDVPATLLERDLSRQHGASEEEVTNAIVAVNFALSLSWQEVQDARRRRNIVSWLERAAAALIAAAWNNGDDVGKLVDDAIQTRSAEHTDLQHDARIELETAARSTADWNTEPATSGGTL